MSGEVFLHVMSCRLSGYVVSTYNGDMRVFVVANLIYCFL